ncbi:hypothetical protein AB0J38_40755 [Streptomyces sp. NPDC050095]|uniref:hypothetical protein n=1 Tax=unclassified Streptomyces TaxID=2593676 RepID=UPI003426D26F
MAESGVTVALISCGSSFLTAFLVLLGDRYVVRTQRQTSVDTANIAATATRDSSERNAQAVLASNAWQSRKTETEEYRSRISDLRGFQEKLYAVRDQLDPVTRGTLPTTWPTTARQIPSRAPAWISTANSTSTQVMINSMRREASQIDSEVPSEIARTDGAISDQLQDLATRLTTGIDHMTALADGGIDALEGWIGSIVRPGE